MEDLLYGYLGYVILFAMGAWAVSSFVREQRRGPSPSAPRPLPYAGWHHFAERHNWRLSLNSDDLPRISGLHQGRSVQLTLERIQGQLRTRIMCLVDGELPPLKLRHIDHGTGPSVDLQHAVADGLIWGEADDEQALRDLLAHPQALGPILGVIHAYPGSEVRHDRVILTAPGHLNGELMVPVQAVVDAAVALSQLAPKPPELPGPAPTP